MAYDIGNPCPDLGQPQKCVRLIAKYISGGILFLLGVYILCKQYKRVSVN